MTTARQAASNRKNARKSTGPRSKAGKQRSAANAIRHGLRARPDADQVLAWFRVILAEPDAQPGEFRLGLAPNAALGLAEAEVRLANIRREEERLLQEPDGNHTLLKRMQRYHRDAEAHRGQALRMD